jgi:predicted dehydrogenase
MKKIAVVGFGFMGMTHALNILKNKDLELKAIVDPHPELIEEKLNAKGGNFSTGEINAADLANINKYSDLDECLRSEELDAVSICVHTKLHYNLAKKALLHNLNVFLEKPLCLNIPEGQELITLAEEKGKVLMIGHVVRFMSPYQKLKEWIGSGEFGKHRFLSLSRFTGLPSWGQWNDSAVREASGGALFDLVIHDIDYANYVLGKPDSVRCSYLPGEYSKHDYISAMWNYKNKNINVKIEGGFTFHSTFPFQAGFMAQFEKASVLYSSLKGDIIQIADDKGIKDIPAGDAGAGYYNEIACFARCLADNSTPAECLPSLALDSIKLCYNHI